MLSVSGHQALARLPGSAAPRRRRTGWEIVSPWIGFAFRANPVGIRQNQSQGLRSHASPSLQALELPPDVLPMAGETYLGFARAKSASSFL